MRTLLHHGRLILKDCIVEGHLIIENDHIAQIVLEDRLPDTAFDCSVDLKGNYLSPGFVEIHSHGAGGADFMDGTTEAFRTACDMLLKHGTTTLLPTTLAASKEEILRSIDCFSDAKSLMEGKSLYLHGLHMEGPYLNPEQSGAIDTKYIRNPDPEEYEQFLEYGRGAIARWTLAVELEGAVVFAERLCKEGILPSIGHSNAEYSQVLEGFIHGVTHVTHLYSAMSSITRQGGFRHSGVLESGLCIPDMTVEVIADGCHLPKELLEFVYRVKGPERVVLTSDSMRCAGQDVKESILGSLENGRRVIIEDGVAKMPDRSAFAGSIATDDRLVRIMYKEVGVPLYDAVRMMTLTPAEVVGLGEQKGSIEVGKDADLISFNDNIEIDGVMVGGRGLVGCFKLE